MTHLVDQTPKEPTINFAIGPYCPVRCEGCYNHFGNTTQFGGLVTAAQVIGFAAAAREVGVTQTTLSGGDPLLHPEIIAIVSGLKALGMRIKLDTVGTALLGDARIVYKGHGVVPRIEVASLAPHVDYVSLPLDGARQETIVNFRRGRANLLSETRLVAGILHLADIAFGFNTVANASNLTELTLIRDIAEEENAAEWQVFEYDPSGPNPSNRKQALQLADGAFESATNGLWSTSGRLRVVCKSLRARSGIYFLVDDSGQAWQPAGDGRRHIIGNITADRPQVLAALREHLQRLSERDSLSVADSCLDAITYATVGS